MTGITDRVRTAVLAGAGVALAAAIGYWLGIDLVTSLGIGAPVTEPEWGRLISQATPFLQVPGMTHLWLAPAGAIAVTTLAFAFVADGLRDALDPRLRGG